MVTGASGYLGGRLCGAFVHGGYTVVALVRKSSKLKDLPPQVELVYGDIRDADSVRRACAGCDFVVHSAALVGSWLPDASQFIKVSTLNPSNPEIVLTLAISSRISSRISDETIGHMCMP